MTTNSDVLELLQEYTERMDRAKTVEESMCIGSAIAALRKLLNR